MCVVWKTENRCTVWVLTWELHITGLEYLEVYGNFEYWTRYDELLIIMKVTEKWDMLALYGVVRLVNSCHINIVHNNVECSTQQWHIPKIGLVRYAPTLRP